MSKFAWALGCAVIAIGVSAQAQERRAPNIYAPAAALRVDADDDGWVTRAEASAAADRMFAAMDTDGDGRLTAADRPAHHEISGPGVHVEMLGDGQQRVIVRRGEGVSDAEIERHIAEAERHAEEAERYAEQAERGAAAAERHVQRDVVIIRRGPGEAAHPPHPPHPPQAPGAAAPAPAAPHAPMFMMLIANSDESDLNGDGAISLDEFRAQHLRFFDASDANGDGRVRFQEPPAPPAAPAPPAPPRR